MITYCDIVSLFVNTWKTIPNTFLGYINTCVEFEKELEGFMLRACRSSAVGDQHTCAMLSCCFRNKSRFGANRRRQSWLVLSGGHLWVHCIILRSFPNINIFSRGWGEWNTQYELNQASPEEGRWVLEEDGKQLSDALLLQTEVVEKANSKPAPQSRNLCDQSGQRGRTSTFPPL